MTAALLSGCGMWQSTKETIGGMTRAIFVTKVKQMNLVIESRAALNENEQGQSLPVVMRVYQLKDAKVFENTAYVSLLNDDSALLKAELLDSMEITLVPDASMALSVPMAADARKLWAWQGSSAMGAVPVATGDSEVAVEEDGPRQVGRDRQPDGTGALNEGTRRGLAWRVTCGVCRLGFELHTPRGRALTPAPEWQYAITPANPADLHPTRSRPH